MMTRRTPSPSRIIMMVFETRATVTLSGSHHRWHAGGDRSDLDRDSPDPRHCGSAAATLSYGLQRRGNSEWPQTAATADPAVIPSHWLPGCLRDSVGSLRLRSPSRRHGHGDFESPADILPNTVPVTVSQFQSESHAPRGTGPQDNKAMRLRLSGG
jgi:hypothetical protein